MQKRQYSRCRSGAFSSSDLALSQALLNKSGDYGKRIESIRLYDTYAAKRPCNKQLVVRRLIRCVHTALPPALHFCTPHWILCSLNDDKV